MKGRKPLPIELHELRGNPGRRPLPKAIPVPQGVPECPEHLSDEVRGEWERLGGLLQELGIVSKVEVHAMEILCETWIRYQKACRHCDQYGDVLNMSSETRTTDAKGKVTEKKQLKLVVSPYFKVRKTLAAELKGLLIEFGLTPLARTRIVRGGDEPEEDDPLDAMLRKRAGMN